MHAKSFFMYFQGIFHMLHSIMFRWSVAIQSTITCPSVSPFMQRQVTILPHFEYSSPPIEPRHR
jgi:hypothetical protein